MKRIIFALMLCPALLFAATRNLVPNADREGYVGKSTNQWGYGYFSNLYANGTAITGNGYGWTNTVGSTTYTNKGLNLQDGTNTRWVVIGGTNYFQILTNSMGVLYSSYAGYSSVANISSNLTEATSNNFMKSTGGVYAVTDVFQVGDGISSYFKYNVLDQILTIVRDGNTFTFNNDGLTISGLGGKFIGDLTGNADTATSAGIAASANSVTGAVVASALTLNGTNMQPWQITNDPTNNMLLSASVSGSVTNPVWTNAPVLAGLTMVGNINGGGNSATNFGDITCTNALNGKNATLTGYGSFGTYTISPIYYGGNNSDIVLRFLGTGSYGQKLAVKTYGSVDLYYWTNSASTIIFSSGITNALTVSAGTNLLTVGTDGPVVISNIVTATGDGGGLTNLQNTVSYLNTNNAAADFSTAGGSFGTIAQNPAWTNVFSVTNRGIAVGCKRIKFAGYIATAIGNQTNTFALTWSTNATGQTKIGAFVEKCHDETKYIYGEIPVNPDGTFYCYCSTNMNAEFTITGAEF